MLVILIVTLIISLCKGGRGLDSIVGAPACGVLYWIFNCLFLISAYYFT